MNKEQDKIELHTSATHQYFLRHTRWTIPNFITKTAMKEQRRLKVLQRRHSPQTMLIVLSILGLERGQTKASNDLTSNHAHSQR